ncbi:phage head spike fiber domain-containing protein [Burkholderia anthina]|uniref:phage head spike fiber domain-containing protein n=1 Tax=Burkholderia anthina TaxID=179879 RepID=UPI001AA07A8D|nr:hypothetical protein [Burkholderia anthina]QTD88730.1 hypothetical protein J4G50_12965 [Burkholderia anthina]
MATGDQNDIQARIARLIPISWFESSHAIRDAIATGLANAHAYIYAFIAYVKLQTRILTATDGFLDAVAQDFFGSSILRATNQSDASFRARILINIFRERATRNAIVKVLQDLTGRTPIIIEPQRPADCGAYGGTDSITVIGTPQIYRNDWQGNQQLYPTARTNIAFYSSALSNGAGASPSNGSFVGASIGLPDTTTGTAYAFVPNTTSTTHYFDSKGAVAGSDTHVSVPIGTPLSLSIWLKASGYSIAELRLYNNARVYLGVMVDLTNGSYRTTTGGSQTGFVASNISVTAGSNGWYRLSFTCVAPNDTGTDWIPRVLIWTGTLSSPTQTFAGDGTSGIYAWGRQFEQSSVPTSYIPTTTSSVTITDYALNSNGAITFSSPPAQGASLTWSGSYASAIQSQTVTVTAATFGVGDGASATFSLAPKYGFVGGYGVAGAYGSVLLPYQAFVIAYRPLGTGIPYVAGYGSAPGGYSQPSRASYADLSNSSSAISDSDIYAAIDSVKPAATILWTNISS